MPLSLYEKEETADTLDEFGLGDLGELVYGDIGVIGDLGLFFLNGLVC